MYKYLFKIKENFEPTNQEQRSELVEYLSIFKKYGLPVDAINITDTKEIIDGMYPRIGYDNFLISWIEDSNGNCIYEF